jgi:hypothetical protein
MRSQVQRMQRLVLRVGRRVDNLLNPIMAKEIYQSVHNRAFMVSFWLLSGIALLIYLSAWNSQGDNLGAGMYAAFFMLLSFVGLLLLPLGAFFGLRGEITTRTLELVQITGIAARRLARGRMLAVAARLVLLCSMLAPFAMLSYLFGGIDVLAIATSTYMLILGSLLTCAVGVWCASLAVYPHLRRFSRFAFPLMLFLGPFLIMPAFQEVFRYVNFDNIFNISGDWEDLLLPLGMMTMLCILLVMFLLAAASNALTFPQNRSSARPKLLALLIATGPMLVLAVWALLFDAGGTLDDEIPPLICTFGCILIFVSSLVWITADPPARQKRSSRNALTRLFRDGPGATVMYLFLSMGVLFLGSMALFLIGIDNFDRELTEVFAILTLTLSYVLYPTALARLITSQLPARFHTPHARRAVLLILLIINVALILVIFIGTRADWEPRYVPGGLAAFAPVLYFAHAVDRSSLNAEEIILHMLAPGLLGLAYYAELAMRSARHRVDFMGHRPRDQFTQRQQDDDLMSMTP